MPRHSVLRKATLGLILLGLLWLSIGVSINGVLATRMPVLTLQWAPWSTAARIALADSKVGSGKPSEPNDIVAAQRLARQALDRSPIQAAAARAIGLSALLADNPTDARAAFAYAERLSRRDLPTQLYWIETDVERGNIRQALRHYDLAMRTSVKSRAMLGNILIAASSDPAIATELARLLRTQPRWLPEFYQRLMGQGENPDALLLIAGTMRFDAGDPSQASFLAMALNRLVALGAYDKARVLYQRSAGGSDDMVHNGGFDRANRLPPFDWTIASEPTYSGIVETRVGWPHGNVLTVTGTEANDVARQLLLLAPGRYRLKADTANVRQERETRPVVVITCLSNAAVTSIPFAPAGTKPVRMTGTFDVPGGCPAQWITIRNTPSFDPIDNDPWIDRIMIQRIEAR